MTESGYYKDSPASTAARDNHSELLSANLVVEYGENSRVLRTDIKGEDISGMGFPSIDFSGFEQESPYKSSSTTDAIWQAVKHIFVKDDTVGKKVEKELERRLSPPEREQFAREEQALQKYKDELRSRGLLMTMESGSPATKPETPVHDAIKKRLNHTEREIERTVRAQMPPEERQELDRQLSEYKTRVREFLNPKDPLSASMMPMPEPGPSIKQYYQRIAAGAEAYMRTH